jgi:hypothetical protein
MQQKYWWLISGIVIGIAARPLIFKIPVVGTVASKLPTV